MANRGKVDTMKKIFALVGILVLIYAFNLGAQVGGGDITMKNSFGNVIFSHDSHMQKNLSCQSCHPEPYVTSEKHQTVSMKKMEEGLSCGLCHNGKPAFSVKGSCTSCHKK
jgi:c(7)-type cytochrome triheme protein